MRRHASIVRCFLGTSRLLRVRSGPSRSWTFTILHVAAICALKSAGGFKFKPVMGEGEQSEERPRDGEQQAVDGVGGGELNGAGQDHGGGENLALPQRRRNGKVVLVAMDGRDSCYDVLRWALGTLAFHKAEAEDDSDELVLLHVQQIPPLNCNLGIATQNNIETVEEQEYVKTQEILDNAQKICGEHNLKAKIIVKTGEPKDVICEMVTELPADVLVMGSHGHGMLKRALLGTTSDYCVNRAKCNVVIAKLKYRHLKPCSHV